MKTRDTKVKRTIIEYCCEEDSNIGKYAPNDTQVHRITEKDDATKASCLDDTWNKILESGNKKIGRAHV